DASNQIEVAKRKTTLALGKLTALRERAFQSSGDLHLANEVRATLLQIAGLHTDTDGAVETHHRAEQWDKVSMKIQEHAEYIADAVGSMQADALALSAMTSSPKL